MSPESLSNAEKACQTKKVDLRVRVAAIDKYAEGKRKQLSGFDIPLQPSEMVNYNNLNKNNNYLMSISPEDARLIDDSFRDLLSYGHSEKDGEILDCWHRFQKQIENNERANQV